MNKKNKTRALALLSGGLDSILAVKILQKQGIKVTGITFASYFFNTDLAEKAAKKLKIDLKIIDISGEHLEMVKKPKYGYGKAINPCIDCHLMMIKKAKEVMQKRNFDFIATGEVLGERPMSQNKKALELIEQESGCKGYLLRPLSAKLLKPTIVEQKGLVKREKLLDISGRNRTKQMTLAKEWGIKEYPTPAGGCLLTDTQFAERFRLMLKNWPDIKDQDAILLKLGRHFWVKDNLIVVGRNKEENDKIEESSKKNDILIKPEFPGPSVIIRSKKKISKQAILKAKDLIMKYSKKK